MSPTSSLPKMTHGVLTEHSFILRKPVIIKVFSWSTHRLHTVFSPVLPSLGTSRSCPGNMMCLGFLILLGTGVEELCLSRQRPQ